MKLSFLIPLLSLGLIHTSCGQHDASESRLQAEFSEQAANTYKTWQITENVTSWLNCRENPTVRSQVIFELRNPLAVDSEFETARDELGRLWMKVNPRGDIDHNLCWVIAEDRYLRPITQFQPPIYMEGDTTCYSRTRGVNFGYFETSNHYVYLCRNSETLYYLSFDRRSLNSDGSPNLVLESTVAEAVDFNLVTFTNGAYSYVAEIPFEDADLLTFDILFRGRVIQSDDILLYAVGDLGL